MKPEKEKLFFLIAYAVIVLALLIYLFFNDYGVIRYMNLKGEISNLQGEIKNTEENIEKLQGEIDSLETNLDKIEKVAREKYHMLKTNEEAYQIEEN